MSHDVEVDWLQGVEQEPCPRCASTNIHHGYGFAMGSIGGYSFCTDCGLDIEVCPDMDAVEDKWYCHDCRCDRLVSYRAIPDSLEVTLDEREKTKINASWKMQRRCVICNGTKLGIDITITLPTEEINGSTADKD